MIYEPLAFVKNGTCHTSEYTFEVNNVLHSVMDTCVIRLIPTVRHTNVWLGEKCPTHQSFCPCTRGGKCCLSRFNNGGGGEVDLF